MAAAAGKHFLGEEEMLIVVLLLQSRLIPTPFPNSQHNHSHETASIFPCLCLHQNLHMLLYQQLVSHGQ